MTEQTIFATALEYSGAERATYLDQACAGNEQLRRQVEELLTAHERSGEFLDEPAVAQMVAKTPPADQQTKTFAGDSADAGDRTSISNETPVNEALTFLKPATRADAIGRLAHYEVLEKIGSGGFGTVLRAFDERLHRIVAIKVLAPQLASSGTARARFHREARAGAAVRDEHVVNIHAVSDETEPIPYLVMEYVAGQTLQQKLDKHGPLDVKEILRIGQQIARGLAAAHATGHIHRDIKPGNILLENGVERVKITDFGLARAADDASISHSGVVAGTPMYMAPEQAQGVAIDHRADLFSLGSVMYAMCTGHPPFRASTTLAILKRVVEEEPRPIREINPEIPQWLCDIVAKLLTKKPEERFPSAKEVAELLNQRLADLQAGRAIETQPVSSNERPRHVIAGQHRPHLSGPVKAVVAVMTVAGLGLIFWSSTLQSGNGGLLVLLSGFILCVMSLTTSATALILSRRISGEQRSSPRTRRDQTATPDIVSKDKWSARRTKWITWAIFGGVLALAIAWIGPSFLSFLTHATLEIESTDSTSQFRITRDGEQVAVLSPAALREIRLPSGDYALEVVNPEGTKPFRFDIERRGLFSVGGSVLEGKNRVEFKLGRGERVILTATIVPDVEKLGRPSASDGWVQLFNGKDLTGWKPGKKSKNDWVAESGILMGAMGPGYLFSTKSFENFHLRAEVQMDPEGNSGIAFRDRFQVEIRDDPQCPTGSLLEVQDGEARKLVRYPKHLPTLDEDWFTIEIKAQGSTVSVRVNDGPWVSAQDPRPASARDAPIELEVQKNTVVLFRKIEIKELPPVPTELMDAEKLQGEWKLIGGAIGELKLMEPFISSYMNITMSFTGDQAHLKWVPAKANIAAMEAMKMNWKSMERKGVFHLDEQVNPKRITVFIPNNNKDSMLGIYRLEQNRLTLCFSSNPKEIKYPTEFATNKNDGLLLLEFQHERPAASANEGFVSLFNGTSLDGWTNVIQLEEGGWAVKDNLLAGSMGSITRGDNYDNFHLKTEYRFKRPGIAAIFIRANDDVVHRTGYAIELHKPGGLIRGDAPEGVLLKQDGKSVEAKTDQWYNLEVIADGRHLVIKVNGETITEVRDDRWRRGRIELHAFPDVEVQFRKIEIRELKPKK